MSRIGEPVREILVEPLELPEPLRIEQPVEVGTPEPVELPVLAHPAVREGR